MSPKSAAFARSSSLEQKNHSPKPYDSPSRLHSHGEISSADRFIPQRRHMNLEAMNYKLRQGPPPPETPGELDVFGQVASLESSWRKKMMANAMDRAEVIPGLTNRRIFSFAKIESPESMPRVASEPEWFDPMWRSKARHRPLIDHGSFTIQLERSIVNSTNSIDWGARNILAAVVENATASSVLLFNADVNSTGAITRCQQTITGVRSSVQAIKWNHAGDKIAMATDSAKLRVFALEKHWWSIKCPCMTEEQRNACTIDIVAWSYDDKHIAICCGRGRISVFTFAGELAQTMFPDSIGDLITSISFSPNNSYFAVTGFHIIRIYTWPCLTPYLEIGPNFSRHTRPMAWHPWDPNVLAVGGFPAPNALSIWDIHRQKLLSCKKAATPIWKVDEMTWNRLSGELVVRWSYWRNLRVKSIVAVLSNVDTVVDVLNEKSQSTALVWNPDSTLLATRQGIQIKIWKFFGDEAKAWRDSAERGEQLRKKTDSLKRRRAIYTDQTKHLEHYNIH